MVKKRKPGPIMFPRVKVEVKSEDKSIPGIDDARDRLKGALQELLDQSDDSSLSSSDDGQTETEAIRPTPIKKERTCALSTPRITKTMKRRRRREIVTNNAFHHTFVMKMFDRSVDLAQFEENSPLYAVCRGWMANQPRNSSLAAKQHRPESPEHVEEDAAKVKDDARSDDTDAFEDVWVMPEPVPLPNDVEELRKLRIPAPVSREQPEISESGEGKAVPNREALLNDHLKHWAEVNKTWRTAAQQNELRYKASMQLLRNMYKRAQ